MRRRRPFRVTGWSFAVNEYVSATFARRSDAEARGRLFAQAGIGDVQVYEVAPGGHVIGTITRIDSEASR